jgi:hypothetical protein
MWTTIFMVIAAAIALLVVVIATRPSDFKIQRQATMAALPGLVHGLVNDFKKWPVWSPWENRDPNLQRTYSGAESGEGAQYHWVGNKNVGEGHMTIVESQPGERIRIKLEFLRPFAATNDTLFTFAPHGSGTQVIWTMSGRNNFTGKAIGLFMNMDSMIGKDFEQGLADMKKAAEGSAAS